MAVSVVVKNACTTVGEGPHWDHATQSLLYVDFMTGDRHRWDSKTGTDEIRNLSGPSSFIIPCKSGGYITSKVRKMVHLDWSSGKVTREYGDVHKGTQNMLNDAKCDAAGRLWAGTMTGSSIGITKQDKEKAALFSLESDGTIRRHGEGLAMSNGLAWSTDNTVMYHVDTGPKKVYAYDFDLQNGSIANQRTVLQFGKGAVASLGSKALPDGMCADTQDKLWLACFGAGKIIRFDPVTGQELRAVEFPVTNITSCCFGGKNNDDLYVTSSMFMMKDEQLRAQPLAGSVFKVTGLGVKGIPVSDYGATGARL